MKHKSNKPAYAKKSLGQNFLVDDSYINRIVSELNPQPGENIIEIGAGRGALTRRLIESGANIIALEIDRDLIPVLQAEFSDFPNFNLIEADALEVDFSRLAETHSPDAKLKLIANLPYYISTAILGRIIAARAHFSELILMLQKEVVERITAAPGNSERGYLSVLVQTYAETEKLFEVPPTAFRPIPKVWSTIIRLEIKPMRLITAGEKDEELFWKIVSTAFAQKRKTILNNLKNLAPETLEKFHVKGNVAAILESVEIDPAQRAEDLTGPDWEKLAKMIGE